MYYPGIKKFIIFVSVELDWWRALLLLQEVVEETERPFYESDDKEDEEKEPEKVENKPEQKKAPYIMDPDHRLLLRQAKPLLNSRNSAVRINFHVLASLLYVCVCVCIYIMSSLLYCSFLK